MFHTENVVSAPLVPIVNAEDFFESSQLNRQLRVLLILQDEENAKNFVDWKSRNLGWHRAIYVKAAKLLDNLGHWAWCKAPQGDQRQARLDLIEIFHFGLSWSIVRFGQPVESETLSQAIAIRIKAAVQSRVWDEPQTDLARQKLVDELVRGAGDELFSWPAFIHLSTSMGVDFTVLFQTVVFRTAMDRVLTANNKFYFRSTNDEERERQFDLILDEMQGMAPEEMLGFAMARMQRLLELDASNVPA